MFCTLHGNFNSALGGCPACKTYFSERNQMQHEIHGDAVEIKEFVPNVILMEGIGVTLVLWEDAAYYAVPIYEGVPNYMDKLLATSDNRMVGFQVWLGRPIEKKGENNV